MDGWKTTFLLGRPIFRGQAVSFRDDNPLDKNTQNPHSCSRSTINRGPLLFAVLEPSHDPCFGGLTFKNRGVYVCIYIYIKYIYINLSKNGTMDMENNFDAWYNFYIPKCSMYGILHVP